MPLTVDPESAAIKNRKQISLHKFFLVPFFALFAAVVLFLSMFSYFSAQKTIKEFQQTVAKDISQRVVSHLDRLFAGTSVVTHVNADFIRVGLLDPNDKTHLQKHFINQLAHLPALTFISYGSINGEYTGATRSKDDNSVRLTTSYNKDGLKVRTYKINNNYDITELVREGELYKASECPWFIQAQITRKTTWYPVYKYLPYEGLGLGVTSPVFDKNTNKFIGAVTADMSLQQVSHYLKKLDLGKNGFAFITEMNGNLIASTQDAPVYAKGDEHTVRFTAATYPDKKINLISHFTDLTHKDSGDMFFSMDGKRYLLNKSIYKDDLGLKMYVYIVLAENDFLKSFNKDLAIAGIVLILASIIGVLVIIRITDHLAKPIHELNNQVIAITKGDMQTSSKTFGNVTEINQLSSSFNTMADKLSESFSTLEQKIEERTWELNRANIQLLKLSNTDELTSMANRRHFNETLEKEWAHASRSKIALTMLMLDVDFFKKYNDSYGHQQGDECLKSVAGIISHNAKRINDLAARYGGEEFAVVMPHTEIENALIVAEKIRKEVELLNMPHEQSPFGKVTISIGVASLVPDGTNTLEDLIRQADDALYTAKDSGRNRVES